MKHALRPFLLAVAGSSALTLAPAWALPDLARGQAALARGDLAAARADLEPLAAQGYVEAQRALAQSWSNEDTPEAQAEALRWYRAAAAQDPGVRVGLARSLVRLGGRAEAAEAAALMETLASQEPSTIPPLQLRLYREHPDLAPPGRAAALAARLAGDAQAPLRAEAIAWYRQHRLDDAAYARALAGLCERDRKLVEECYADLARHFREIGDRPALKKLHSEVSDRHGAGQLTATTLERIARALSADDLPGAPAPESAYALLSRIADPPPAVMARRARLLLDQPALDPDTRPEPLLQAALEQGSPEAALQLGRLYLDEAYLAADPLQAQALLQQAAATLPAAHTWLGRLYERGYLGQPDPVRALQHYLVAARAGNSNADMSLARMVWRNRGVKVDVVLAYSFARLAQQQAHPGADELLLELLAAMSLEQIERGRRIAQMESAARLAARPAPTPPGLATAALHPTGERP